MKWWISLGIALSISVVLIANWKLLAFMAWMIFFGSSMCGNDVAQVAFSPGGEQRAVLFQRDCGAMTGFTTQVSIIGASDDLPNEIGNVFIAPGHPETTATVVHWKNGTVLVITTAVLDRANLTKRYWGDVTVEYVGR